MKDLLLLGGSVLLLAIVVVQMYFAHRQKRRLARVETEEPDSVYLFTSPSCGVCTQMKRTYGNWIDSGSITSVDISEEFEMARHYGIMSVPATVVVRHGKVAKAFLGFVKPAELLAWLPQENGGES